MMRLPCYAQTVDLVSISASISLGASENVDKALLSDQGLNQSLVGPHTWHVTDESNS